MSETCRICGKELIDPESVKDGIGPVCRAKLEKYENFEEETTELAQINEISFQLSNVENITDVRKLIAMADAYLSAARSTYRATKDLEETKEDSQRSYNIGVKAAEIRLRAEARLGEIIREMQERGELATGKEFLKQNRNTTDGITVKTLNDIGLSPNDSSRAQQVTDNQDLIPQIVKEAIMEGDFPTRKSLLRKANVHVSNNSGEYEWYTPIDYIEAARLTMESIDLDPASSDIANGSIKAETYYTEEQDGLTHPWFGNVWLNPPYSQPLVSQFCDMLVENYLNGSIKQACVLVNNATETKFYQNMLNHCSAVCFIKGRVRFIDINGESKGAPLQGQTILYFGKETKVFAENFCYFGVILYA